MAQGPSLNTILSEKHWWRNPWLHLLMSPVPSPCLMPVMFWVGMCTFACRLPCFLFATLSPHRRSLEQSHSQGDPLHWATPTGEAHNPRFSLDDTKSQSLTERPGHHYIYTAFKIWMVQGLWLKLLWPDLSRTLTGSSVWAKGNTNQSSISPAFRVHTMSCCLDFHHECSWDSNAKGIGLISTGKYSCHLNVLWNNLLAAVMGRPPFCSAWLFQGSSSRDLEGKRRRGPHSAPPSPSLASACIFEAWNWVSGVGVRGEVEVLWNRPLLGGSLLAAGCISLTDWLPTGRSHLLMEKHVPLDRNSNWLGSRRPGFWSWLCHQLALWHYASQSSPLCVSASST